MAATNWMPDCRRVPTGAYGGYGSIEADTVVCHSIEGWRTTMDEWASEKEVVHQASYRQRWNYYPVRTSKPSSVARRACRRYSKPFGRCTLDWLSWSQS